MRCPYYPVICIAGMKSFVLKNDIRQSLTSFCIDRGIGDRMQMIERCQAKKLYEKRRLILHKLPNDGKAVVRYVVWE